MDSLKYVTYSGIINKGFLRPPENTLQIKGGGFASPSPFKDVGNYHEIEPGKLSKITIKQRVDSKYYYYRKRASAFFAETAGELQAAPNCLLVFYILSAVRRKYRKTYLARNLLRPQEYNTTKRLTEYLQCNYDRI